MHAIEERGFYLPAARGELFCLVRAPRDNRRGSIVLVPPFAEELNKCRRMLSLAARALAARGWAVWMVDLFGTGDSDGDFGDADWLGWRDDLIRVIGQACHECSGPLWLWPVRAGALLASQAIAQGAAADGLLMWQPQLAGKLVLNQFLRLKLAASLGESAGERVDTRALRAASAAGQALEIAGYTLSPGLVAGLDAATFELPIDWRGAVHWLEVGEALLPASAQALARLREKGIRVDGQCVEGTAFWQTVEVGIAPQLIEAGVALMDRAR